MLLDETSRHVGRYYGKFRATVVDTADEENLGMLQVEVPDVFGDGVVVSAEACLPYAQFAIPQKGAVVWVEFEAGDPERPLWIGMAVTSTAATKVKPETLLLT